MDWNRLTADAKAAMDILIDTAEPKPGEILVIGCSTSEVLGQHIGSASSEEAAAAIMEGVFPRIRECGLFLAVQGCEHINRALVVERACMERYGLQEVWVRPWLHAGGAFSMEAMKRLPDFVMVEDLRARAALGMDIGGTMIGMHLHPVVVPMHTQIKHLGEAMLIMARSRPKYVGGPRAQYFDVTRTH